MLGNHFAQLVVPFFLFAPAARWPAPAAGIVIVTQLWLVVTGNFAWLNWMAIVLAFAAVSDPVAHAVAPADPVDGTPRPRTIGTDAAADAGAGGVAHGGRWSSAVLLVV